MLLHSGTIHGGTVMVNPMLYSHGGTIYGGTLMVVQFMVELMVNP